MLNNIVNVGEMLDRQVRALEELARQEKRRNDLLAEQVKLEHKKYSESFWAKW